MPLPPRPERVPPRFILRLDDLPKIVQADGVVCPIYLSVTEAARLFAIRPKRLRQWLLNGDLPVLVPLGSTNTAYISVSDLADWITANTRLFSAVAKAPRRRARRGGGG